MTTTEEQVTDRLPSQGYVLTAPPRDPYVAAVVFVVLWLVARLGSLPDGVDESMVRDAVEALFGGGAIIAGIVAELWRRRVKNGNRLK